MHQIIFPGLGLEFNMSKIAFTLFGANVYWYATFIVIAIITSMIIFKIKDGTFGIKFNDIFDAAIYVFPISILSARLYYIIFNNPGDIVNFFNFRTGGLAIYGGIIGGITTIYIFTKKRKINLLDFLDYVAPILALGQCIGRWGNFINIEAYGKTTTLPWRMGIIESGNYIEVHPTFLYESIITLFLFILLTILTKNRKFSGQITYTYLFVYAFARFFIENLRTDSLMLFNFRISGILSIIICVVICSFFTQKKIKEIKMKKNNNK